MLILQSYNERYEWTRSIGEGISRNLGAQDWDIWYEYLDAKNLDPGFDYSSYDRLLSQKYRQRHFDLVVVVDDPAYLYYTRTRHTIFNDARALAIGLNAPPAQRLPDTSYIIEIPDYTKTINVALFQNPHAKMIHLIVDRSITGRLIRSQIEAAALSRPVHFDWIDSGSWDEIDARTTAVAPGEIVIFAVYFDPAIGYVSNNRILARLREHARVPIYAFWAFNLSAGALGGYLYDGERLGQDSAAIIRDMVERNAAPVYHDAPQGTWIFDWPQAQTFRIPIQAFPLGTVFRNQPVDFWEINRTTVIIFLVGFVVLAGFTLLILFYTSAQRNVLAIGERMIATQRDIMNNLGNVIETRSEETAFHVQRITRLSLLMAELLGLSAEQKTQIEVCAPMHDIGKIGIPDKILKKAGSLTEAEMALMRTHTQIGHSIFKSSPNPVFQAAARIALEHHERWDGQGYPQGKAGNEIDLLARIVSVVDVFDALLSERSYKAAWPADEVRAFLEAESGLSFDPALVRLMLDNWESFLQARSDHGEQRGHQASA